MSALLLHEIMVDQIIRGSVLHFGFTAMTSLRRVTLGTGAPGPGTNARLHTCIGGLHNSPNSQCRKTGDRKELFSTRQFKQKVGTKNNLDKC
ncbi:hypothetical protein PVAP13_5NG541358 [Panicum virgatum]|uniref:Uncharacterized protein n=1 Tax=Panicum virgatum TaxID=38727 RepID=A0A8T0S5F8_PANVG|nr:hypothetical protein PVAP13_5NG541358 [Panicum virgatum]